MCFHVYTSANEVVGMGIKVRRNIVSQAILFHCMIYDFNLCSRVCQMLFAIEKRIISCWNLLSEAIEVPFF